MGFIDGLKTNPKTPQGQSSGPLTPDQATLKKASQTNILVDQDFANLSAAGTAVVKSGNLAGSEALLHGAFSNLANQRKGDVRTLDFTNSMRAALVEVATNPKSAPEEKAAARRVYEDMRMNAGEWSSNPSTAPGFNPKLNMPPIESPAVQTLKQISGTPTLVDKDFTAMTDAATSVVKSGQLAESQSLLTKVFSNVSNQRKGDVRSYQFTDTMRAALVDVATNPKSTPQEKAAARAVYKDMQVNSGAWTSNPKTAPGYNPKLDMPSVAWQDR